MKPPATIAHEPDAPETLTVRRRANRSAGTFDGADPVYREVGRRLIEHLEPVRLNPRRVLELGAGTGAFTADLLRRYPGAEVIALDFAARRLAIARRKRGRWRPRQRHVCADAAALPLADASVDLVVGNLLLPWLSDPAPVFRESARVLRHGGLVAMSAFGPDTLRELRSALPAGAVRCHALLDMHDFGDALVRAGISDVVADVEHLRAPYRGLPDLANELKRTGATNAAHGRSRGLTTRARIAPVLTGRPDEPAGTGNEITVTYETVYLHGWWIDRRAVEVAPPAPAR